MSGKPYSKKALLQYLVSIAKDGIADFGNTLLLAGKMGWNRDQAGMCIDDLIRDGSIERLGKMGTRLYAVRILNQAPVQLHPSPATTHPPLNDVEDTLVLLAEFDDLLRDFAAGITDLLHRVVINRRMREEAAKQVQQDFEQWKKEQA